MIIQGLTIAQSVFVGAYLEAALFTEEMDEVNLSDLPEETIEKAKTDCLKFINDNHLLINDCENKFNYTFEQAGHDFWLTRNGHGAGFWDRGLQENGEALTNACKAFGEVWIYEGDDGLIYFG